MPVSLPRRAVLAAAIAGMARPTVAQQRASVIAQPRADVLRFVPGSAPGSPDPLLANPIARTQSHMIWDMLYGLSAAGVPSQCRPKTYDYSRTPGRDSAASRPMRRLATRTEKRRGGRCSPCGQPSQP